MLLVPVICIIKSILVSVSERQINDTFNNTFHNDINMINSIKLFGSKSEQYFNKIDILCFFNYIILKILHPEQYQKANMKKVNSLAAFIS